MVGSVGAASAATLGSAAAGPLEKVPHTAKETLGRGGGNSQARKYKDS